MYFTVITVTSPFPSHPLKNGMEKYSKRTLPEKKICNFYFDAFILDRKNCQMNLMQF